MNPSEEIVLSEKDFKGWESRSMKAAPSSFKKEGNSAIVEAVVTTEKAAEVIDWERWEMVKEILLMGGAQIPESKQVPFLDSHSRFSTSSIKGSIRNLRIEEDKLIGDVHVWSEAKEIMSLIEEGHLTDLSVGYKVSESDTVEIKPGMEASIDGKIFKNDDPKMRLLVRTKWWVKEGSAVAIGADDTSKFRTMLQPKKESSIKADDPEIQKIIDEAVNKKINSIKIGEKKEMNETEELTVEQRAEQEVERREGIKKIADTWGKNFKLGETKLKEAVEEAIGKKWSTERFSSYILDNFDSSKPVNNSGIDLTEKEKKRYSLSEAIFRLHDGSFGKGDSGLVKEVSDTLQKSLPSNLKQSTNSILVPDEYFGRKKAFDSDLLKMFAGSPIGVREFNALMQRAIDATTAGSGGVNLVGDDFRPDLFIELLRSELALGQAGVTILTGLKENITIPKQLTDATFEIVGEGNAASEGALTFDQVTSSPKIGSGWVEFTKQLLIQSNPSIDALVRESLLAVEMRGVDKYGIVGGGGITGLINETDTNDIAISSGDPSWTDIVAFETAIEDSNAKIGDIKWLMAPRIKGRAKTTPKLSNSEVSGWLMDTNGEMNGYQSVISTLMNVDPLNAYYLILGVFKQMMLNRWGATEIQVNPFSKDTQGIIRVVLFTYFDWVVRQPTAFAISDDVTES